jgi:hypothetical protein
MQRYDELNCWNNGLLSALLVRDPSWEAASGMTVSSMEEEVSKVAQGTLRLEWRF